MNILRKTWDMFASIFKGLGATAKNWAFTRPSVTVNYPEERLVLPERYRGMPTLPVDEETGDTTCIACGACMRICPEHVITVTAAKTDDPKNRKPEVFTIDISRCMWCGLCMEVCPKDCLKPARKFELSCETREEMIYDLQKLKELGGTMPAVEKIENADKEDES